MKEKKDAYAFISYSSANRDEAQKIFKILTSKRFRLTCWLDVVDINLKEEDFPQQIYEGIKNASCLIFIDTEEARQSVYVDLEQKTAIEFNIPIFRYQVKPDRLKVAQNLYQNFLAQRVKFRVTQPFWVSLLVLSLMLAIMAGIIYFFGALVFPSTVKAASRLLPDAVYESFFQPVKNDIAPDLAAPFHYIPDYALLLEDFNKSKTIPNEYFKFDLVPRNENVKINIKDESLIFSIPSSCYPPNNKFECSIEIRSQEYSLETIQYFSFRARVNEISNAENLSLSISIPSYSRRRSGFGWNLSESATPFFRSTSKYPEEDFYAHVELDSDWHAYEILLNPENGILSYYVDGQFIDSHNMKYYEQWKTAPLVLIIYSLANGEENQNYITYIDSEIEIDQIIVGGFN